MKRKSKSPENSIQNTVLLIAEDSKDFEIYSDLIQGVSPCRIDVMKTAPEFPDWIDRANYHLIIVVDEGKGISLLEQIKRVNSSISVILISKDATVEKAVAAIKLGAEDYLAKPFKVDAFQLAVKRGLDRKMVFGEHSGASHFLHLLNSCQMISGSLEQKKIFEIIQSYLTRELGAGFAAIYSFRENEPTRLDIFETIEHSDRALGEVLDIAVRASNALAGISDSFESYRFVDPSQLTPGLFIFRFKCAGESDYFCVCLSPQRPESIEAFESRLRLLKAQIEVTGKNIEHYLGVQQLVYVDDATGLYNTRYLNYILDREIANSQMTQKPFAVLFMDADKFKAINDKYGHLVGTKILNELGHHLKKYVREKDTVFRYGGDEFVAVLSSCDLSTAKIVAERIRESVEKKIFMSDESLNIQFTISIGVALFPEHAKTKREIIDTADYAMYSAKKTTRNRVSIAQTGENDAT